MLKRPVADHWPITLGYGYSPGYPNSTETHWGIDYGTPKGEAAWFREAGTIIFAGLLGELGLYCQMQSEADSSRFWGLAHLSQIDVRFGQRVFAGEPVALTGGVPGEYGSGKSTGSHLHEQVNIGWRWGKRVDPDTVLEDDMTPEQRQEIERCLGVIWGWAFALDMPPGLKRRAQQRQAAKELKDAINIIKSEAGIS